MSTETELSDIENQLRQLMVAGKARNKISSIYSGLFYLETFIVDALGAGTFELIPTETKQALNRMYQLCLTLKAAMEADPDFAALITLPE